MLRRNKISLPIFFLLITLFVATSLAQAGAPNQSPALAASSQSPTPASSAPANSPPAAPSEPAGAAAAPASTPTSTSPPTPALKNAPQDSQDAESSDSGVFVFRKQVEEVVLHATVIDDKQRIVTTLDKGDFNVIEDGHPQTITSFRHEDIPVAMGIVVDNSGSMREKRQKVNAAALNLVRASNPHDEVCVVNFNDEYYLDQPFTSKLPLLKEALEKVEARGGTALYDAIVATSNEMKSHSRLQKKVLLVVTDGEDNASRETLEETVRNLQQENGPTVYAIGLLGEERARRARRGLETIAQATGGIAFLPRTLDEVDQISSSVAH